MILIKISEQYCFLCDECPLISKDDLERRLALEKEYGEFQFDHLCCEKIGHAFFIGDYCEDAFLYIKPQKKQGRRTSGLAYRRSMTKKKKERLMNAIIIGAVPSVSGYVDYDYVDGTWIPVGKYVKRARHSNKKRFYKKYSNHKLRRGSEYGSGKSGYKRCYDYWWEIF